MVTFDWQYIKIPKIKVVCVLKLAFCNTQRIAKLLSCESPKDRYIEGLNWNFLMVVNLFIITLINLMIRKLKRYKLQGQT